MSSLRNRVLRRFSIIGRVADLAFVGGMALRLARRKGWIDSKRVNEYGLDDEADGQPLAIAEMVLAGAAVLRLMRRKKR
jgi:hypothetical protein